MDEKEIIWRELEKDIDLYKFYLNVIIKSADMRLQHQLYRNTKKRSLPGL